VVHRGFVCARAMCARYRVVRLCLRCDWGVCRH
jgi:hypothetical protein